MIYIYIYIYKKEASIKEPWSASLTTVRETCTDLFTRCTLKDHLSSWQKSTWTTQETP